MKTKKYKLIGSGSSLDSIVEVLKTRWHWSDPKLDIESGSVYSGGELIESMRIVKKKNRYRLEKEV